MNRQRLFALLTVWFAVGALAFAAPALCYADPTGELQLTVLIIDELTPKPVPLTDFKITADFGDHATQTARTDEHGVIDLKLPPGRYIIESLRPVNFKGHSYQWKSTAVIEVDKTAQLKLTDGDAQQGTMSPVRQVSDEAAIYKQLKGGVVTVESESGHGSGFVIDKSGLVLTNAHVVNGSHWFAIRFGNKVRVQATLVTEDRDSDVAMVMFNPAGVGALTVLPLADASSGPIAVEGEKVLAIGNPLSQTDVLTTGIVSKVEGDITLDVK